MTIARMHRTVTNREKKMHEIGVSLKTSSKKKPTCTENGCARADYIMQQTSTFESI